MAQRGYISILQTLIWQKGVFSIDADLLLKGMAEKEFHGQVKVSDGQTILIYFKDIENRRAFHRRVQIVRKQMVKNGHPTFQIYPHTLWPNSTPSDYHRLWTEANPLNQQDET